MKNIELKKLAQRIQKNYRISVEVQQQYSIEEVKFYPDLYKKYQKYKKDSINNTISQLNIGKIFGRKEEYLSDIEKTVKTLLLNKVPTTDYFFNELRYIRKIFKPIKLKKNALIATTKNIILEDIELGPFEISLDIKMISKSGYVGEPMVIPLKPNYHPNSECHPHPNVSDNFLCAGEGEENLNRAVKGARVFDYFEIVNSILNTYGAASAFEPLNEWNCKCCYECNTASDEYNECYYCKDVYLCYSCDNRCIRCDDTVCNGCGNTRYCESCARMICYDCSAECSKCEYATCLAPSAKVKSCLTKPSCCKSLVCIDCSSECISCNKIICIDHLNRCDNCYGSLCSKCIKKHKGC